MTIQALLVEDNNALAETIATYLEMENIGCDYAANGRAGLNLAMKNTYHAILLDINLPKMNGLQVCDALRQQGIEIPILMLTARDSLEDKLAGFDVGTDDYLVKPFQMEELVARIRALAHRRSSQSKKLVCDDLVVDVLSKKATRAGSRLDLTPTGWIILVTLMRNSPNVVSRETLIQAVWDDEAPDTDMLKVHMYRLRQQLDKPFKRPLIQTIPNHGFAIRGEHD